MHLLSRHFIVGHKVMTHNWWLIPKTHFNVSRKIWVFENFEFFEIFKIEVRLMSWSGPRVLMDIHVKFKFEFKSQKFRPLNQNLKIFQIQKPKISQMKSFLDLLSRQKWSELGNISPAISLILRKLHIGIKSWLVLNTICEFLIAMGFFFGNCDFYAHKIGLFLRKLVFLAKTESMTIFMKQVIRKKVQ